MDEYTAWNQFEQTGSVSDYLAYCKTKASGTAGTQKDAQCIAARPEELYENTNGSGRSQGVSY